MKYRGDYSKSQAQRLWTVHDDMVRWVVICMLTCVLVRWIRM